MVCGVCFPIQQGGEGRSCPIRGGRWAGGGGAVSLVGTTLCSRAKSHGYAPE